MKRILALMVFIAAFLIYVPKGRTQANAAPDAIIGKWLNPDGTRRMEIYKGGDKYFGKIIWLRYDDGNVKTGDIVLKNLSFTKNQWKGIALVKGKELDCSIAMPNANTMNIKGKIGFISTTKTWTRVQ